MVEIISDPFWSDSPEILSRSDRFLEFFVTKEMTFNEKLNALARLGIFTSIVLALYHNNIKFLLLSLVALALTYFVHSFFDKSLYSADIPGNYKENFTDTREKLVPTLENPFMNPVLTSPDDKVPTESYSKTPEGQKTRDEIEKNFSVNLFQDVSDIFETNNSRRQYYTVPRDDGDLKNFLYGSMKSGKEDQFVNGSTLYEPLQSLTDH